jgi:hypothetical protein
VHSSNLNKDTLKAWLASSREFSVTFYQFKIDRIPRTLVGYGPWNYYGRRLAAGTLPMIYGTIKNRPECNHRSMLPIRTMTRIRNNKLTSFVTSCDQTFLDTNTRRKRATIIDSSTSASAFIQRKYTIDHLLLLRFI